VSTDTLHQVPQVAPEESTETPFPGPRPFREDEEPLFFGRDRERSQLRSLVLANSLVLLYAGSGAGKTSLIRAALIPALVKRGVTVFPILRIRPAGTDGPGAPTPNPYLGSIVANWAASQNEPTPAITNLSDFMSQLATRQSAPEGDPRVVIIDQFEELFTCFPEHWELRADFFAQLEDALSADPDLRILLSMREDYIPQTDPFGGLVSNHLQQRLRIETLRRPQALAAVTEPLAATRRRFAPQAAEYLVEQLLRIRLERNGLVEEIPGEYVEPVQLQVVCQRLWDELSPDVREISETDVRASGDVDDVLASFYTDSVRDAAALDRRTHEGTIRAWIEGALITTLGTRGTAHRDAALGAGVSQRVLDELVNCHLLRAEWRNGSDWYEITHDRFIGPIQDSNAHYRDGISRRRLRTAALIGVPALLVLAAALCYLLLTRASGPSGAQIRAAAQAGAVSAERNAPSPPTILAPAQKGLYRVGAKELASYRCRPAGSVAVTRCSGPVPSGAVFDTQALGPHRFTVTATFGNAGIATTRSVTYRVVDFASTAFKGHAFTIDYPRGWRIRNAETKEPGYTDTTIASNTTPGALIRVDVAPRVDRHLNAHVRQEMMRLEQVPQYHLIRFDRIALDGESVIRWQFEDQQGGVLLQKEDDFFNDPARDKSIAVLAEAPRSRYPALVGQFDELRSSLVMK
jgi:hypothetical protein